MISDHPSSYTEMFRGTNDPIKAFYSLLSKLAELFSEVGFTKFKRSCLLASVDYPQDLVHDVRAAKDLDDILLTLSKPMYCNWLNTRLLKRIVSQTNINEAKCLIQDFEENFYAKKVTEVAPYLNPINFKPEHLNLVQIFLSKNAELLVVQDVVNYCRSLEEVALLPQHDVQTGKDEFPAKE